MTNWVGSGNVSPSFSEQIATLNREATAEGERWFREKRNIHLFQIFIRIKWTFISSYILKGFMWKGYSGFIQSINHALYQLFAYARYWELTEQERGKM